MKQETIKRIEKIIDSLDANELTIDNIMIQSLMHTGGTITEQEAKKYIDIYISIGFCQPKFYTKETWSRANKLMKKLCILGIVYPHDFGRGKGKYACYGEISKVKECIFNPSVSTI